MSQVSGISVTVHDAHHLLFPQERACCSLRLECCLLLSFAKFYPSFNASFSTSVRPSLIPPGKADHSFFGLPLTCHSYLSHCNIVGSSRLFTLVGQWLLEDGNRILVTAVSKT